LIHWEHRVAFVPDTPNYIHIGRSSWQAKSDKTVHNKDAIALLEGSNEKTYRAHSDDSTHQGFKPRWVEATSNDDSKGQGRGDHSCG
jgi:hypothetical protein